VKALLHDKAFSFYIIFIQADVSLYFASVGHKVNHNVNLFDKMHRPPLPKSEKYATLGKRFS